MHAYHVVWHIASPSSDAYPTGEGGDRELCPSSSCGLNQIPKVPKGGSIVLCLVARWFGAKLGPPLASYWEVSPAAGRGRTMNFT